ncbi:hypothetical protein BS47DRAFT_1487075 [Hydnum rufescens UP504]|uniref:DUF6534 domain-containing protein n=1 Tax=Hydnum rufescens UP504 TaxID=1448309 RepID=A0A9P6AS98_9AGAM|nr:hypothetical protein BS47DRAFT_1487075 [Hydnum rufescens UP504]
MCRHLSIHFLPRSAPYLPFIMEIINVNPVQVLGSSLFGNLLATLCFGVLTVQTSSYYYAFPNDGRPVKLTVAFLWTLEAVQVAFSTWSLYWWSVTNYRNPLALEWESWQFAVFQIGTVCSSVTVQTFFAYRVYSLSANLYIGVLVQVLVFLQFGFGVATFIKVHMNPERQVIVKEWTWLASWLAIQATTDIAITTCMCLLLRRRRTGFQKTDSVINRMVLYTISTGLVTGVLSCIDLVLFALPGRKFGAVVMGMLLAPSYSITMLANVHMRTALRASLDTPTPLELMSYSIKKRMRQNTLGHRSVERLQAPGINVTREVVCDDVDIKPMGDAYQNSDAKVPFTVVQGPGLGGPEPEPKALVWPQ